MKPAFARRRKNICVSMVIFHINLKCFRVLPILACCLFSFQTSLWAQSTILSGYVRDAASGESLVSANVRSLGNGGEGNHTLASASTNAYGFFSLRLPPGQVRIEFSHIGYNAKTMDLDLSADTILRVDLEPSGVLDEIVVSATATRNQLNTPQMGLSQVDLQDVRQVPVLLGERDVLKTIQLLPGVLSGGEGSSTFFVRGGMGDQNLILLDDATVFNASHLFGFFSTFNSDAIKQVDLYKGEMPAQYGGRLASVLDIQMLEGNNKSFQAEGGIGLIASRLKVEGPIVRDRASFVLSGRRTYADMFLRLSSDETVNQSQLYFYDLNLKANYQLNDRNRLYLSGYFGKDMLGYSDVFRFGWGNSTASLRWNRLWNHQLFSNTTLVYSDYNYRVDLLDETVDFVIASRIGGYNLKQDFHYYPDADHVVRFGLDARLQQMRPATIDAGEESPVNTLDIQQRSGLEIAAYASHEWTVSSRLSMVYGLRANQYLLLGPGVFFDYDAATGSIEGVRGADFDYHISDFDLEPGQLEIPPGVGRDEIVALLGTPYGKRDVVHRYWALEPRLSLNYRLDEQSSLKAAVTRNSQFIHQLSNATSSLPTDSWVLSSNNVKPQFADQFSVGYYRNFAGDAYEFSVESYYKDMRNQIEYRDGADLPTNDHLDAELVFGIGRSYGVEWHLKKQRGRWHGWLSYALSKSERKFDQLNGGRWFNARQDRTHDFSGVLMYELGPHWSLSGTFVYATGHAVTFPSGKYTIDGQTLWYYHERNGYRMPDYHRLDIGVNWERPSTKGFSSSWSFGLFNAYNRKNAYIIDFREGEYNAEQTEIYRIALFGAIPSVTWNFKF